MWKRISILFSSLILTTLAAVALADTSYRADLSGSEEVPPVATGVTGYGVFYPTNQATAASGRGGMNLTDFLALNRRFSGTSTANQTVSSSAITIAAIQSTSTPTMLEFELFVNNGRNITAAHLHCGSRRVNGPIVAHLFDTIPGGVDVNGRLAGFVLTERNIMPEGASCTPAIRTIADLQRAIDAGQIYANVHSADYPNGLIRGQLMTGSGSASTIATQENTNDARMSSLLGQLSSVLRMLSVEVENQFAPASGRGASTIAVITETSDDEELALLLNQLSDVLRKLSVEIENQF